MENREIVEIPAYDDGPVTAKADDFEPLQVTNEPKKDDSAASGGGNSFDCPGGGRPQEEHDGRR